ncbi:hypothetical protein AAH678_30215 [Sodalis endosymbiont of Spalangia cameroni]|uniref:hypothetical protein n=1 Tax=Sodalis praecaptivus TaxID=1239307 RepID=UPI0031F7DF65
MQKLMDVQNLTMCSLEIAELVKSRHDNVKVTIERLAAKGIIQLPAMQDSENINNLGLLQKTKVYVFTGEQGKRDSIVVVAQLCPELTALLVDRWQELEKKVAISAPATQTLDAPETKIPPIQKENVMNDNLIQLARVVAEATASATMKVCIDVTGYNTTVPSLPAPQRTSASTSALTDDEYAPVSETAYATGFADSACRRLIKVAHIPVLSKGLRGLRVHIPTFLKVANDVMREATPPQGNRKRWSHPKIGSFTYRGQI